jgi:hypothetical protein
MHTRADPTQIAPGTKADYRTGLVAGVAAGLATTPLMLIGGPLLLDMDPWAAAKMPWSLLAGEDVIRPGFEWRPVLGGLAVHLALSALFGLVFAALASLLPGTSVLWGAAFGFALYVTNILVAPKLLPAVAGHMFPTSASVHLGFIAQNVVFGVLLAGAYRAWRR